MLECEQFQELMLEKTSASMLDAREAAHARTCGNCAAFLADVQAIDAALAFPGSETVPERIRRTVMTEFERLHPAEIKTPDVAGLFFKPGAIFSRPRLVLAGCAAAVLAVIAVRFMPLRTDGDGEWTVRQNSYMLYIDDAGPGAISSADNG